ncbi:MAG: hypothetical protein EBV03_00485 [Proteobacteria bacterium]|nr:hypothetical protein [Pseudomonadota bacterium]
MLSQEKKQQPHQTKKNLCNVIFQHICTHIEPSGLRLQHIRCNKYRKKCGKIFCGHIAVAHCCAWDA